jgi:hypothetical protein
LSGRFHFLFLGRYPLDLALDLGREHVEMFCAFREQVSLGLWDAAQGQQARH